MKTSTTMSPLLFCLVLNACGGGSGTAESQASAVPAVSNSASASQQVPATAPSESVISTTQETQVTVPALAAALPANAGSASAAAPTVSGGSVSSMPAAIAPVAEPASVPTATAPTTTTAVPSSAAIPAVVATVPPVATTPVAVLPTPEPQPAAIDPIVVAAASPVATKPNDNAPGPAGQDASQYVLTFEDGFDSGSSFDLSKWATDIYYKPNNPTRNYNVSGGTLNIWPATDSSGAFFDRTIVSENRFAQQYGYFEVEAKLPVGAGLHPVISLTANNGPEIAMMHAYSGAPNGAWSSASLHPIDYVVTAVSKPDTYIAEFRARTGLSVPDLSAAFHKYGVRWDATTVRYYFDGVQVGQAINHNTIRTPMYFFIGLWMVNEETSARTGAGTLSQANPYTPQGVGNAMKINYVRAWRFKNG
jgi:beta-glucanase (GH16 family)